MGSINEAAQKMRTALVNGEMGWSVVCLLSGQERDDFIEGKCTVREYQDNIIADYTKPCWDYKCE